jgi:hypothetical protein
VTTAYSFDVRSPIYEGLRKYALAQDNLNLSTAQSLVADIWRRVGIDIESTSPACRGVANRAIKYLAGTGDLVKTGRDSYKGVAWFPIEESDEHQVSTSGRVRHRDTGKVLAVREDSRGRELVNIRGRTYDTARLTRKVASE